MNNEQFPMIQADPKAAVRLTSLLAILNPALEAKSILNPKFIDAKYKLNQITEQLFFCSGLYYNHDLWFTSSSHAANRIKLAQKLIKKGETPAVSGFYGLPVILVAIKEIQVLHEALQSLKGSVVKRQVRSEEERAEDYVPPMPTTPAALKVTAILKEMTDGLTLQYQDLLYEGFVQQVKYALANPIKRQDRRNPSFADTILMPMVGDNYDSREGIYTSLNVEWMRILLNKAKSDADYAQRMFLYKNVMKLAIILEKKNYLASYEIRYGRVSSAGFQGEIIFMFADGSDFVVRNKVVAKYSVHNHPFHQFPTTFHAAKLPNGTLMPGQPSEQEMIEQFCRSNERITCFTNFGNSWTLDYPDPVTEDRKYFHLPHTLHGYIVEEIVPFLKNNATELLYGRSPGRGLVILTK